MFLHCAAHIMACFYIMFLLICVLRFEHWKIHTNINHTLMGLYYYRPQTKFAKVSVCPQGGSAPLHGGINPLDRPLLGRHPLGRPSPGQTPPPWAETLPEQTPLLHSACWDTVNKRVVRIPLECILVYSIIFTF